MFRAGAPSPSRQCVSGQAAGKSDWVHPQQKTSASVTLEILETTALNQLSTKASITAWLSVDHDADEVRTEVDRLVREGYLAPVRPEAGPQVPL